ncbi:MAG: carboxypeptidase regulatory-like domain-containing protein [Bacteroidota bacterium]
MKQSLPRFLVLILAVFSVLSCSDNSTNAPETYSISGTVHQAGTGSVVSNADIIAQRHEDGAELGRTVTDGDGAFLLKGLPAEIIDIVVAAEGFSPIVYASMDPKAEASTLSNMSVQMTMADSCCSGVLTLTLKNANGELLVNKAVVIKKAGQIIADPRTNEQGKITEDNLCAGEYSIRIAVDGYKVYEAVFAINGECDPVELTAVLQNATSGCCDGVLTVNVKDENGNGVGGAEVRLWKNGAILHKTFTDTAGVAVFTDLCRGEYGADVSKTGVTNREFSFAINENCEPVTKNVVVESLGCCSGIFTLVVRDANGNPVQGARVLVRIGSKIVRDPVTDANGRIVTDGLCKGEYNYRISKDGYAVVEGMFAINVNCDPVTREATLAGNGVCCSGVFTLIIRDANGNPIQGVVVAVKKAGALIESATTNANGQIVVDGLCQAEYTYRASKDGFAVIEGSFAINSSCEPVTREATMQSNNVCCSGVFTIVVRDANGNPVQGAKVVIKKSGTAVADPVTNSNGAVVVDGLCKGEYSYRISKDGFSVVEGSFAINELCEPVTREATLTAITICCSGVLTVNVVDSTNTPVEGATVKLWQNGAVKETVLTSSLGVAVFDGLCKGEYGVNVTKTGYNSREFTFAINVNCEPFTKLIELIP